MKIKFLGTAAAEGIPAIFCTCENCKRARALGGRNWRTRSHAIVNDKLLVDFPADTFQNCLRNGIDLSAVTYGIITHIHADHFYTPEFHYLKECFGHLPADYPGFLLAGSEDAVPFLEEMPEYTGGRFTYQTLAPFTPTLLGDITVTALPARHSSAHPYIYIISDGKSSMLYGNDTGIFPEESWEYLEKTRPHLDLVSLDCTEGASPRMGYDSHMNVERDTVCRERLTALGCADESTVFVLHHFSHNGKFACYDDMRPYAEEQGFLVSYDGMELAF